MIKKSRKILTLLLASLLIMSSMCALTVSAATTFNVPSNSIVVTNDSNTATYTFTNAKETGWYELGLTTQGASTNDTSGKLIFKVTATIGDANWSGGYVINTGKHYPELGAFYLENGVEYTLNLSFDFSQATATQETISAITFTKNDGIAISSTESTFVGANKRLNSVYRLGNREDALWTNKGTYNSAEIICAVLPKSTGSVTYRVNAATTGLYDIYSVEGAQSASSLSLSVDGTKITTKLNGDTSNVATSSAGYTALRETKLGRVVLTAGSHNIEVKNVGSNTLYAGGIKLVPVNNEAKTVGATGETEVSFYNDILKGVSDINYSAASYQTYPEEGLSFTSTGYVSSGGAVHYASYPINVTQTGLYDISFIGGKYTVGVTVEVDGVAHSFAKYKTTTPQMTNGSKTLPSGATAAKAAFKDYVCSIYLTEGIHQIKYKFGTSGYYFAWTIKAADATVSLSQTEAAILDVTAAEFYETSNNAALTKYSGVAATGVYAGTRTCYISANGSKFYYLVNSPNDCKYTLSAIVGLGTRTQNYKVTNAVTGEDLCNGSVTSVGGNYDTTDQRIGEIELQQGKTLLKIETVSGTQMHLFAFKLTPYIENKIIADINTEINQGEGYETVTIPVKFEGNLTLTSMEIGIGYEEGVQFVSAAAGTGLTIGTPTFPEDGETDNPVKMVWIPTDFVNGNEITTGTLATFTFNVPKSTVKDYTFTVTVADFYDVDDNDWSSTIIKENGKVTVKSTAPIFTFTNGSTTVNDVEAGTMVLNVDLNGNNKNLVIFAIYSTTSDGYSVLEYSNQATPTSGEATVEINEIELDSSKNYYAKAFVWDTTSYYGFVQTLDN